MIHDKYCEDDYIDRKEVARFEKGTFYYLTNLTLKVFLGVSRWKLYRNERAISRLCIYVF